MRRLRYSFTLFVLINLVLLNVGAWTSLHLHLEHSHDHSEHACSVCKALSNYKNESQIIESGLALFSPVKIVCYTVVLNSVESISFAYSFSLRAPPAISA